MQKSTLPKAFKAIYAPSLMSNIIICMIVWWTGQNKKCLVTKFARKLVGVGGGVQSNWSKNGPKIVFLEWFNSARKLVGVYFPKCICVSVFVLKYNLEMKFDRCQNFDQPTTTFSHKVVSFGTTKSWNGINTVKLDKHRKPIKSLRGQSSPHDPIVRIQKVACGSIVVHGYVNSPWQSQ